MSLMGLLLLLLLLRLSCCALVSHGFEQDGA